MNSLNDKLKKIVSDSPSNWTDKVEFRRANPWLREYSSQIARRILAIIENDEDLNQAKLADLLKVRPQQISKIVQGQENLTLETIYKISKALGTELITFPDYKYSNNMNETAKKFMKKSSINLSYNIEVKEENPMYLEEMQIIRGGGQSYDKEGIAIAS
jgi:plasmid maintenance system antidote protein VapI